MNPSRAQSFRQALSALQISPPPTISATQLGLAWPGLAAEWRWPGAGQKEHWWWRDGWACRCRCRWCQPRWYTPLSFEEGRKARQQQHSLLTHTHTLYCTSPSRSAALARVLLLFFPPKEEEKEDSSHWWWQSTNREKETTVEHTKNETAICCCLCHD